MTLSISKRSSASLAVASAVLLLTLAGCATAPIPQANFPALHAEAPRSILIVPALNNTVDVRAPDFFVSTVSRPFAERGYYVFPAHMVKRLLEDDGLSDAGLVHSADTRRLGKLFGCDAALFVQIQRWDSRYVVLATTTTVSFDYTIKSCKTGTVLWKTNQSMQYSPQQNNSSASPLAALISQAISAAIEKGAPNFMPLTIQANAMAVSQPGMALPEGPYLTGEVTSEMAQGVAAPAAVQMQPAAQLPAPAPEAPAPAASTAPPADPTAQVPAPVIRPEPTTAKCGMIPQPSGVGKYVPCGT
jgi:hypothetical protein